MVLSPEKCDSAIANITTPESSEAGQSGRSLDHEHRFGSTVVCP